MNPKLLAFDLDGTLLTSDKKLSPANRDALLDMHKSGATVALASGRIGSSMIQAVDELDIELAMLTLNGAAVYTGRAGLSEPVYNAPLPAKYAQELVEFGSSNDFAVNYYIDDELYSIRHPKSSQWIELYHQQTKTRYNLLNSLTSFDGRSPSKIIFVGDERRLDGLEAMFRERWDSELYICRTWNYYLEFLSVDADKGNGIRALAKSLGIAMKDVAAFGDADNDIPMLEACGMGIAMQNATDKVKKSAWRVSSWTNDQDGVAREWQSLKSHP